MKLRYFPFGLRRILLRSKHKKLRMKLYIIYIVNEKEASVKRESYVGEMNVEKHCREECRRNRMSRFPLRSRRSCGYKNAPGGEIE